MKVDSKHDTLTQKKRYIHIQEDRGGVGTIGVQANRSQDEKTSQEKRKRDSAVSERIRRLR